MRRHYFHSRWLDWTAPRSARLVTLLSSVAFGICTAVGILYVLRNAQERPVPPVPIYATETAPAPAPPTVELGSETRSSPSIASDNDRSPWSLQLIGDSSETRVLAEYRNLQKRFPAILGSRTPIVIKRELGGRSSVFWYQVRLTEHSHERASALCTQLRSVGGECLLLSD